MGFLPNRLRNLFPGPKPPNSAKQIFFEKRFIKKIKKKQKTSKNRKKIDEFGGFGPGNKLLRRFGGIPSKNRRNRCLGGDFLGQNKILNFCIFPEKNGGQAADVYIYIGSVTHGGGKGT